MGILAGLMWREIGWRFYQAHWNGRAVEGPGDGHNLITVFPPLGGGQ